MITNEDLGDIRPFIDEEVESAINELIKDENFIRTLSRLIPSFSNKDIIENFKSFRTLKDFQYKFTSPLIKSIINMSTNGFSFSGIENINPNESYLFVSNHRDIVLDVFFMNIVL